MKELQGTGKTSQQIKCADGGAYFVWPNNMLTYAEELAKSVNRKDVKIISLQQYQDGITRGTIRQIIFDHTIQLRK